MHMLISSGVRNQTGSDSDIMTSLELDYQQLEYPPLVSAELDQNEWFYKSTLASNVYATIDSLGAFSKF